jgi:hypothetical protein
MSREFWTHGIISWCKRKNDKYRYRDTDTHSRKFRAASIERCRDLLKPAIGDALGRTKYGKLMLLPR